MSDLAELINDQLEQQGVSVIRVSDGHVLTFTAETLARLQEAAKKTGRVVVFVKHGVSA